MSTSHQTQGLEATDDERSETDGDSNLHIDQEKRSDLGIYGDDRKRYRRDGPYQGPNRRDVATSRRADGRFEASDEAQRFWVKVRRQESGCWEWLGTTNRDGYGMFRTKRGGEWRYVKAHRWAYEAALGPIREGLTIDHLCRNRACVHPGHLEPVTAQENARRVHQRTTGVAGGP